MRNGDLYKIRSMAREGISLDDICHKYRWRYEAAEIKNFLPELVENIPAKSEPEEPEKPRARKKAKAKTKK